ncbi:hypothetical protein K491DRAFT_748569 [Lophiostoma macrostomum CBS 122681]|uniref:BTB domain-containing protein n=1 Tax=Lophiostoma macrostomum CBS 122681 TaxID=1314788 RepID=A0A6A6T6J6_9PLEO|nr:hypothetical protein K491DRAFT_748569 [Lophiostoma macrostomum CBS 122681]
MSKKRKVDEMSTLGDSEDLELDKCPHHEALLAILRADNLITVHFDQLYVRRQYRVSRDILRKHSTCSHRDLENPNIKTQHLFASDADTFELFLQWSHTQHYEEPDIFAPHLLLNGYPNFDLRPSSLATVGRLMPWSIKAAILGINFGAAYESPGFQNHCMKRLIYAYSRDPPSSQDHADTHKYIVGRASSRSLVEFMQDVLLKRWTDLSRGVHEQAYWTQQLASDPGLLAKVVRETSKTEAERRERRLDVGDYWVEEKQAVGEN